MISLNREQKDALVTLMAYRGKLKRQEYKTLKGLIYAGDVIGALKGLEKIIKRNEENRTD